MADAVRYGVIGAGMMGVEHMVNELDKGNVDVSFTATPYLINAALKGSDALFISTDWEEFRGLSSEIAQTVQPPYLIMDGRRMISDYDDLVQRGYAYLAVGSPVLLPANNGEKIDQTSTLDSDEA